MEEARAVLWMEQEPTEHRCIFDNFSVWQWETIARGALKLFLQWCQLALILCRRKATAKPFWQHQEALRVLDPRMIQEVVHSLPSHKSRGQQE